MKIKMISTISVIVVGVLVLALTLGNIVTTEANYKSNIANARANAEKELPYNAYQYYQAALNIRCKDEGVYKEFLQQAEKLGQTYYRAAVEDYIVKFPMSADGYELLCGLHYDSGSYNTVLDVALEAREKGIATEKTKNLYNECSYMFRTVKTGVEEAYSFLGGYALVKIKGLYGYMNEKGGFLVAPLYEHASAMMGSGAAVKDKEEWHIINLTGFKISRPNETLDYIGMISGGLVAVGKNEKYGYTDTSLALPKELPYDYAGNFKNGVAAVKKGDKWALINKAQKGLTEFVFDDVLLDENGTCYTNGVVFVKQDGKYYMIDQNGKKITDQAFDDAKPFAGSEPAAVCINGKWGFVNASGKIVIDPQYEKADSFNIGLGAVCMKGKWGYINSSGTVRIECLYEECKPFSANGIAALKVNGLWQYVRLLPYC